MASRLGAQPTKSRLDSECPILGQVAAALALRASAAWICTRFLCAEEKREHWAQIKADMAYGKLGHVQGEKVQGVHFC